MVLDVPADHEEAEGNEEESSASNEVCADESLTR
jgi:hypothetical protein